MKYLKIFLLILVFGFFVGSLIIVGGDYLKKTSSVKISISSCVITSDKPLKFKKDQTVAFKIETDTSGAFELHGLNEEGVFDLLKRDVQAGKQEVITFTATPSGYYTIDFHPVCEQVGSLIILNEDGTEPAPFILEPGEDDEILNPVEDDNNGHSHEHQGHSDRHY